MKTMIKTGVTILVAATLFTGCSVEDLQDDLIDQPSSSSYDDVISIAKTGDDFKVTWIKNNSGYGEVMYAGSSEDTCPHKALTANGSGVITFDCTFSYESNGVANYNCIASNLEGSTPSKSLTMQEGVEYQWYPTYGFDHEKGEVDATTEYTNGTLTVE